MTSDQIKQFNVNNQGVVPTFKGPFGVNDTERSYPTYFDTSLSTPVANGGLRITRHMMNGLGYFATVGSFLDSIGYQYEWNAKNSVFGGYPKGAIVSKLVTENNNNHLYEFVNTVDDNTLEPVLDEDGVITEDSGVQNGWQSLNRMKEYSFFPNYENRTLLNELVVTSRLDRTFSITAPGWVLIEREIANWEELTVPNIIGYAPAIPSVVYYAANEAFNEQGTSGTDRISLYEGKTASRFIPCSDTLNIRAEVYSPVTSMTIRIYLYEMEG